MTEKIFLSQLKNLRRSIHADTAQSGVFVCSMIDYLNTHSTEQQQRQEYYGMLLNELLCDEVVGDAQLCHQTLLPVINAYAAAMGRDDTDIWADIFERYLGSQTGCHHPIVYADIMRICRSDFRAAAGQNVGLPLDDEFDLSQLFCKWSGLFERYLADRSSWTLLRDADCRNALARFLCSQAECNPSDPLRIVFPFPGIGLEPLLLAYTVSLMSEAMSGRPAEMKLILLGDPNGPLRSINPNDNNYDEVFINLKQSFCEQNHLKIKELKTTLKSVKRKITVMTAAEWSNKNTVSNWAMLNYQDEEIIGKFNDTGNIILECQDSNIPKLYEKNSVIAVTFDREHECEVQYIHCVRKNNPIQTAAAGTNGESAKSDYIGQLYAVRDTFSEKEMKKKLAQSDYIVSEDQMIRYAELLLQAGQYAKSFNVIKQYYETDFDKSYQLLQLILSKCKNKKINDSIERFIVDKEMKPNGFGEAMLEAIVDGIEDYFDANPESVLKDKQWL